MQFRFLHAMCFQHDMRVYDLARFWHHGNVRDHHGPQAHVCQLARDAHLEAESGIDCSFSISYQFVPEDIVCNCLHQCS